ncbi:MAG: cbb3-type cytochrome c oxidase N-terminal domain-containing protein [Salibacteraceae bacterium]
MNNSKIAPYTLTAMMVLLVSQLSAQDGGGTSAVVADIVLLWALIGVAALLVIVNFVLLGTIKGLASDKGVWEVVKAKLDKSKSATAILLLGSILTGPVAMAQSEEGMPASEFIMGADLFYALLAMNGILLALIFYQISVLRSMLNMMKAEEEAEAASVVDGWASALTDTVPIEREEEIMFEHEHDGIRELDNNLPPWWLWGFYLTIAIAPVYIGYYQFGDWSSASEYEAAMIKAEEEKAIYLAGMSNLIDENNVEAAFDEATLAEGREIWVANCVACHGDGGEGGVGPNMTDAYWLHGGGVSNVFKTIKYGVPAKGMIPWEAQLSPGQMKSVASYILSLEGSNPANPKEPQGDIWKAETAPPEISTETDSSLVTENPPLEEELEVLEEDIDNI